MHRVKPAMPSAAELALLDVNGTCDSVRFMGPTSRISLQDKVIVITGASRGIGEAIARACVEAGGRVVLASRKQDALEKVAASLGNAATPIACHTGKRQDIEALFSRVTEELGGADALINNAATNPYFGPMLEIQESAFDKTFEVNAKGYFQCTVAFVRQLRARQATAGSIVNVASTAGLIASPFQGVYAMTKAAVLSMTKTFAHELGSSGIRVNAIAPGLVETRFAAAIVANDAIREQINQRTALKRHAQPDEIAAAAVYLASDAASFVTGETLVIDGGLTV